MIWSCDGLSGATDLSGVLQIPLLATEGLVLLALQAKVCLELFRHARCVDCLCAS